ncbi:Alpha/Beta hydrolase protein [Chytridium lagenaria]|nr:Alpha/Beta hydrolase protein [Chytridium lagenaria]
MFALYFPGFGNICHQWDLQVDYFSAISDYSVCIFDNRGSGLSSSPKGRYKTSEMAMDAQDLVNQLGWEKFHLVGLSMGGMIAQELAHLCRHRLLSLTLESTYAYFNGLPTVGYQGLVAGAPKGERSVESFAAHVVNNLLFPKAWLDEGAPEGSGCATNRDQMIKFVVDRFSVVGLQDPQGRANQQVACMTHWMSTKRLTEIRDARFPVLVMTGTDDNVLIQPSSSIYLASILGGRLEVFEGGGHALRLQYPIRHNALLHNHLKTSWRIFTHRQKDAIMASLAAGHHSTNSQRSTVVWGGEASHDRGWVEEKDPTFPDLAVERHIVEEVEFAEHLLLPSRRTRESVATISTTTSVRSSTVSPQPLPCSPLLAVPEPRETENHVRYSIFI